MHTLAICAMAAICLFLQPNKATAQAGSIDFGTPAPPPTDADKANARKAAERASFLATQIQTLASAMKASLVLREEVSALSGIPTSAPSTELVSNISAWQALLPKAVIKEESSGQAIWSIDPPALQTLIAQTITLASKVKLEKSDGAGAIAPAVATQISQLSLMFDAMAAEHGVLNRSLRMYPYVILEKQSPISCETINAYSRNYKCLPSANVDTPDISAWRMNPSYLRQDYCEAKYIQHYHVDASPPHVTMVRKASFTDHVLPGQLKGAVVASPQSRETAAGTC